MEDFERTRFVWLAEARIRDRGQVDSDILGRS